MNDPAEMGKQLKACDDVTVTLTPAAVFAILCEMQVAEAVPGNPIGQVVAAKAVINHLRERVPETFVRMADKAAGDVSKYLEKEIRRRLAAASVAACECPN